VLFLHSVLLISLYLNYYLVALLLLVLIGMLHFFSVVVAVEGLEAIKKFICKGTVLLMPLSCKKDLHLKNANHEIQVLRFFAQKIITKRLDFMLRDLWVELRNLGATECMGLVKQF